MTTVDQATVRRTELSVVDPTTGEPVGTLPTAGENEVVDAVSRAHAAQAGWAATPAEQRGAYLHAMADALAGAAEELAELNRRETGKLPADCRGGIEAGIGTLRQYAELGPVHRGHSLRGNDLAADYTVTRPRGVVAALTPWNDPVAVAMGLIGAALVTGNTVVHKPSERNPHLGLRLGEVLSSALPENVLVTVTGAGDVGRMLTADERVNVYAHVGSTATGRDIARAATGTGAHVIRENGGNDALVIDETVDPAWAASQAAIGCFVNAGQICTSVERVYVHRAIADEFLTALEAEADAWTNAETPQPVVDRPHRDLVHGQVTAAVEAGAQLVTGGQLPDGPGAHYPATVLTSCTPDMEIMREETFGPVAPVQVVDSFDEGLERAADDRYGLAATVLTTRLDRALRAVNGLKVGTVKVNNVFGGAPGGAAQPHGDSGEGFGYGPELLDEMTTTSVVHLEFPQSPDNGEQR
ncbi:aldehyde dehydrogenase family protein [Corynebacterium halotolerans]|uniref:Aldehyde dehydrogenase n=1 Tax=Corynebacterium halotolerans YIM 70093 = DSM 44683 TaxID=1121362 RepID=M1MWJ2_9CORY|nr:aldehyde dehydrogenase family protein [Corynebacterium halotolerans]AGF72104.1 aldehyde dehydrogenase [Corynebacterium halotolerans YIM 70093 = DSM 44683]